MSEKALSIEKEMQLIGEITWLFLQSKVHQQYPLYSLHERVIHPLKLGQYKIFYDDQGPIGFTTWSYVSDEWHFKLRKRDQRLPIDEWNNGSHLWFQDFIAPFGHAAQIRKTMNQFFPQGQEVHYRRYKMSTKRSEVRNVQVYATE
ncbi:toxin-activating lysine-acyltransferase [Vibrio sp.]|nr:toxin-activating lysine-acyltransferase [Vibrio sp.]